LHPVPEEPSCGRIFAQVCCASSSTNETNCTSLCSAGLSLAGGAEVSLALEDDAASPLPRRVKRLRWKIRLRTSTMIVPPMPRWIPPIPPPPLSPRRSSMLELSFPGVQRIVAL